MINSFIYPDIKHEDRRYAGIAGDLINVKGDWKDYLPPNELQSQNGIEPSSCFIEAQQACIAILKEFIYGIKDENYSARFNALLANGTETGGDPLKGAYSIKKDGLIPQSMMDWAGVKSWSDFHSWKGVNKEECLAKGQQEAREWDKKYYILFEKDDPIEVKYNNIRQGLKRSPVPISVYAWLERDGKYYKPEGASDTHLTTGICIGMTDNNELIVRDTYKPYIKTLEANTNPDFGMYWIIRKKSPEEVLQATQKSLIIKLLEYVARLIKSTQNIVGKTVNNFISKQKN